MLLGRLRNNECKLKEERYRLNRKKTFFFCRNTVQDSCCLFPWGVITLNRIKP